MRIPDYAAERAAMTARIHRQFEAAEAYARKAAPADASLIEDLWSFEHSPASFAAKYPEWYLSQWGIAPWPEFDWDAIDINPWAYLQACLGVRRLAVPLPLDSPPVVIQAGLEASELALPRGAIESALAALPSDTPTGEVLRHAAVQVAQSAPVLLINMLDFLEDRHLLAVVRKEDFADLSRLAVLADTFQLGLRDLRVDQSLGR